MEAVHEGGKALIALAQTGEAAENAEIDPRIQPEQVPFDTGLPVLGEKIAQAQPLMILEAGGVPATRILAHRATFGQCRGSGGLKPR
jgi:hypothetical protein